MISLSMRGLMATLAMVVTVPSASSRIGTDFLTALATATGTVALAIAAGACAAAFCGGRAIPEKYSNARKGEHRSHPHDQRSFLHLSLSAPTQ